jgi:hypothetical protein
MAQDSAPLRFSLRSWFVVVAIIALGCACLPSALASYPSTADFRLAAAFVVLSASTLAYVLGCIFAHVARPILCIRVVEYFVWILLAVFSACTCYLFWARHRWLTAFIDAARFPRALPYPDERLLQYHDWLDARIPAAPGHFKIHGEIYTVFDHLHFAILACIIAVVFILALIIPDAPIRITKRVKDLCRRPGR